MQADDQNMPKALLSTLAENSHCRGNKRIDSQHQSLSISPMSCSELFLPESLDPPLRQGEREKIQILSINHQTNLPQGGGIQRQ